MSERDFFRNIVGLFIWRTWVLSNIFRKKLFSLLLSFFFFLLIFFLLFSSLFSLHSSSQFYKLLSPDSVPSQLPSRVASPGGSPNSLQNNAHAEKALWLRENHTFDCGSTILQEKVYILKWSIFVVSAFPTFSKRKVYILECPSWRHSNIP